MRDGKLMLALGVGLALLALAACNSADSGNPNAHPNQCNNVGNGSDTWTLDATVYTEGSQGFVLGQAGQAGLCQPWIHASQYQDNTYDVAWIALGVDGNFDADTELDVYADPTTTTAQTASPANISYFARGAAACEATDFTVTLSAPVGSIGDTFAGTYQVNAWNIGSCPTVPYAGSFSIKSSANDDL